MNLTRDAFSLFHSRSGALSLQCGGYLLHSEYNPIEEGRRLASSVTVTEGDCVVILGVGLGYHIQALLQHPLHILAIDFHPYTHELLARAGFSKDFKDIRIFPHELSFEDWFHQHFHDDFSPHLIILQHPPSIRIAREFYEKITHSIHSIRKRKLQSYFSTLVFARRWHENSLKNIPYLRQSYCVDSSVDLPVLIVGSGASLDSYVGEVAEVAEKCVVVALAPTVDRLLGVGVEPHFVLAADGGVAQRVHFYGSKGLGNTVLVCPLSVHPCVVRSWKSMRAFIQYTDLPLDRLFLPDSLSFPMQASVALSAFHFALRLTGGDVFLLGLDFAFVENRCHFNGNALENFLLLTSHRMLPFETKVNRLMHGSHILDAQNYSSQRLKTTQALEVYRVSLQSLIRFKQRRVFSLSAGGARMDSVQLCSFEELHKYPRHNFTARGCVSPFSSEYWAHVLESKNLLLESYTQLTHSIVRESSLLDCLHTCDPLLAQITQFSEKRLFQNNPRGIFKDKHETLHHIHKYIKLIQKTK